MPPHLQHEPSSAARWTPQQRGLIKDCLPGLLATAGLAVGEAAAETLVRDTLRAAAAEPVDEGDPVGWLHAHLWTRLAGEAGDTDDGSAGARRGDERAGPLAALPTRSRAALALADIEGLSYAQLARALGTSRAEASVLLHDARWRSRQTLLDDARHDPGQTTA